ncbi:MULTISPECIES: hypothetical protein [Nocardia]|uniref:hypothetical protein n=1 Tax=Nocardia TaxID=1817 RepID=UPI002458B9D5|nr:MULTISPECIES: hypothetical protein [Nocardia]
MTSATLWFRRADVLELAEHAMAAVGHSLPPFDESAVGSPSLIWVKDDGIYLVSNGLPRQPPTDTDHPASKMHVVYAHGHGSGTHWHHGPPLGDDFVEYLPLTASLGEDATPLIGLLRGTDTDTAAWLVITVEPDAAYVELRDTGPS